MNMKQKQFFPETCNEEDLSEAIEEYIIENTPTECIGLQSFAPNWYRDIKSKKDIDKIVQRLEDIQIIGEIPMKHWDKNSIICKINIINPDYIIKSGPIETKPKHIEEFKMHIEELLKLRANREINVLTVQLRSQLEITLKKLGVSLGW